MSKSDNASAPRFPTEADIPVLPTAITSDPTISAWRKARIEEYNADRILVCDNLARLAQRYTMLTSPALPPPVSPAPDAPALATDAPSLHPLTLSTSPHHDLPPPVRTIGIVIGHSEMDGGAYSQHLKHSEYSFYHAVFRHMIASAGITILYARVPSAKQQIRLICTTRNVNAKASVQAGITAAYRQLARYQSDAIKASNAKLDAIFELHFNASDDQKASGQTALYLIGNAKSEKLASAFRDEIASTWHLESTKVTMPGKRPLIPTARNGRGGRSLALGNDIAPMTLVEPFFGSSTSDTAWLLKLGYDDILDVLLRAMFVATGAVKLG